MTENWQKKLKAPFPKDKIHWRIGSTNKRSEQRKNGQNAKATKGIPLAYIDARDVMERLDDVLGPENWQAEYPFPGCCRIGVFIESATTVLAEWVWKSNGAGETDIEGAKGQYSDAFKRAAVLWGVGRYLYDLPNEWVDLDDWGKPKKLPNLPKWALPGSNISQSIVKEFVEQVTEALENGDDTNLKTLWSEWTDSEDKVYLWGQFNSQQRSTMKERMK